MHSFKVQHGNPEQHYVVLHDGGWPIDGDVIISLDSARVKQFTEPDHDGGTVTVAHVSVPFLVLASAVADAVRSHRIERLESQDDRDLLGL